MNAPIVRIDCICHKGHTYTANLVGTQLPLCPECGSYPKTWERLGETGKRVRVTYGSKKGLEGNIIDESVSGREFKVLWDFDPNGPSSVWMPKEALEVI